MALSNNIPEVSPIVNETKSFSSSGVNISYTKISAKDTNHKPIIFVHGNSENGKIFAKVANWLSKDYAVYCPDSRSHGLSEKVKRLTYEDMAEDIVNLIKHENLEKPLLYGFSDGGIIGLLIAMKYPEILGEIFVSGINLSPKGVKPFWRGLCKFAYFLTRADKLRLMCKQPNILAESLKAIKIPVTVFYAEK
ncbi:MAG: alpha/beta hydrolase, partial [Firmicutes bacterium]|nr:alpha/beta hydrolase [Bacillota bacterium]